jgi:hypothetical protein
MKGYAFPETLVETAWLEEHLGDAGLQVVEVDVDTRAFDERHLHRRRARGRRGAGGADPAAARRLAGIAGRPRPR